MNHAALVPGDVVLSRERALELVAGLCARAGVPCADAETPQQPIMNAVVVLPAAGLVARVSARDRRPHMLRELRVAAWLRANGIPAGEPAPDPPRPQAEVTDGLAVTWWGYLPHAHKADAAQVCAMAARIHRLTAPRGLLPAFDPFPVVRRAIEAASGMSEADREQMRALARDLEQQWISSRWPLYPPVVLHGDVHGTNVLATSVGIRVVDLEDAAMGPWPWDLTVYLAGREVGWIDEAELERALTAYGKDPRDEPGLDLLVQIRLLRMSAPVAAVTARAPTLAEQARLRIASVTDPGLREGWWWGEWAS